MIRVIEAPARVPPTVAQQIFVIGSGVAGGLAGFILARDFAGIANVPTRLVVGTTIVSILATVAAGVYLARKAKEAF